MERFDIHTSRHEQMVDVTGELTEAVRRSGVQEGFVIAYSPHTTAGLTVNENADPNVAEDILQHLGRLVPTDAAWKHVEGNAEAHVKASLMGSSVTVPIAAGRLALGRWQGVFLCEFDGPRDRRLLVRVVSA